MYNTALSLLINLTFKLQKKKKILTIQRQKKEMLLPRGTFLDLFLSTCRTHTPTPSEAKMDHIKSSVTITLGLLPCHGVRTYFIDFMGRMAFCAVGAPYF